MLKKSIKTITNLLCRYVSKSICHLKSSVKIRYDESIFETTPTHRMDLCSREQDDQMEVHLSGSVQLPVNRFDALVQNN
jgi:hypothetical protein